MKILTNICTDDLHLSKAFYIDLLGLRVKYDSEWYVQLSLPDNPEVEFGLILRNHALIPKEYQQVPNGMYVTFVVPNVDRTFARAKELKLPIVQEPKNEFYGQRRFLTKDPSGCLVDISSPF